MSEKNLSFFPWVVIPAGLRGALDWYLKSFENHEIVVGQVALAALQKIKLEERHAPVKLFQATNVHFDLDNNAPMPEIIRRARPFGLKPCRHEVALSLREQYASQLRGEVWWIATEPMDSIYGSGYFAVVHDSRGLSLCFGCGGGTNCWWGKMRRALWSPATQEKLVSMKMCECPWSRRGRDPITVIFEKD